MCEDIHEAEVMTAAPSLSPLLLAVVNKIDALAALDITIGEPCGNVTIDGRWAEIGAVIIYDDGQVRAVPCLGTTSGQIRAVVTHAEIAKANGPEGSWWVHIDGLGWVMAVFEAIVGAVLLPAS